MYFRALPVVLALLASGCSTAQLNRVDPPIQEPACDSQNPYLCDDGKSCCHSWDPVCNGPDAVGYYCEPLQSDPDDPTHMFGAERRYRPTPRVDRK